MEFWLLWIGCHLLWSCQSRSGWDLITAETNQKSSEVRLTSNTEDNFTKYDFPRTNVSGRWTRSLVRENAHIPGSCRVQDIQTRTASPSMGANVLDISQSLYGRILKELAVAALFLGDSNCN